MSEEIIDPGQAIVDPHHHLWRVDAEALAVWQALDNPYGHVRRTFPRYLDDQFAADLDAGHHIVATVYAECGSMFRKDGPEEMRCVGEVEFANGIAAVFASGAHGAVRACAGIVGHADLALGEAIAPVIDAQIMAAGARFKGIRHVAAHDPDIPIFARGIPQLFAHERFRDGLRVLQRRGLRFDAWLLEPQLGDLVALADAMPDLPIVLDHCGSPLGIGRYAGRRGDRFDAWRASVRALAERPNMWMKLGGLGMPICGFPSFRQSPPATSAQIAAEWSPYIETCIEAFGPERCMFESNYPTDAGTCDYRTLWNAFKRIVAGASTDEKEALFRGSATRFYALKAHT